MKTVIIPDSGPLISMAAGGCLHVFLRFPLLVTDVVKAETFDRGLLPNPRPDEILLLDFYNQHAPHIQVIPTQVGQIHAAQKKLGSNASSPKNLGELSIQSLLTQLNLPGQKTIDPIIIFEDAWFMQNVSSLAKPFSLLSTDAFLVAMEKLGVIPSAAQAWASILASRPGANTVPHQQTELPSRPLPRSRR